MRMVVSSSACVRVVVVGVFFEQGEGRLIEGGGKVAGRRRVSVAGWLTRGFQHRQRRVATTAWQDYRERAQHAVTTLKCEMQLALQGCGPAEDRPDRDSSANIVQAAPSVAPCILRMSFSHLRRWPANSCASIIIISFRVFGVAWNSLSSTKCHFWRAWGGDRGESCQEPATPGGGIRVPRGPGLCGLVLV